MIIAVDVDGVACDLYGAMIAMYNAEHGTNYIAADVKGYDFTQWIPGHPEAASKLYQYLYTRSAELYRNAGLIAGAREGIDVLRRIGRVVYATDVLTGHLYRAKLDWLIGNGLLPTARYQPDLVCLNDKSLVRADFLIDDKTENIEAFEKVNGRYSGVLFKQPWNNGHADWQAIINAFDIEIRRHAA